MQLQVFTSPDQETTACFAWNPDTAIEAVTLISASIGGVVEHRSWAASKPLSKAERQALTDSYKTRAKARPTAEQLKNVPWGSLSAAAAKQQVSSSDLDDFQPPTSAEVEALIRAGNYVMCRNSRDLRAHARALILAKEYLQKVVLEGQSLAVLGAEHGLSFNGVRAALEHARVHGYLSRTDGPKGGELLDAAWDAANQIHEAADQLN